MWNKIKTIIVIVLATLGVLFIILMIIPDDEDEAVESVGAKTQEEQAPQDVQETYVVPDTAEAAPAQDALQQQEDDEEISQEDQNIATASVNIPASELSDKKIRFTTRTLDGKSVNQDIFSDHDITLVHVWGTYCGTCISEMGKYAQFYKSAPKNVNLVGIICDVYDGIDSNVDDANEILSEAGAGFMNLRTSDSIYELTQGIQVIPSCFFVDREGHVIGEVMMGQRFDATIARLNGYLR